MDSNDNIISADEWKDAGIAWLVDAKRNISHARHKRLGRGIYLNRATEALEIAEICFNRA